jgi:hypothetical protein
MALQSFDTQMADAQSAIMMLLKSDASVSYRKAVDGAVRPGLVAVVRYDDGGKLMHKRMPTGLQRVLVTLYNDATAGVSLADDGPIIGDAILVAPAPGVTAKWSTIAKKIKAAHNLVTWEVR